MDRNYLDLAMWLRHVVNDKSINFEGRFGTLLWFV